MKFTIAIVLVALGVLTAPAVASAAPYRTDAQAERHLERTRGGSAFCLNGYYSRTEQRTGRHFHQRNDERFRSFGCVLTTDQRTRNLYLRTRLGGGWVVRVDR